MKEGFKWGKLFVAAYVVLAAGIILFAYQPDLFAQTKVASLSAGPPMSLTVVGSNGTVLVLNASDIANLPPYSGYGAWKGYCGAINDLGNYTGVSLATLCNLVGGINSGDNLQITSAPGAAVGSQTFNYSQVMGDFVTYDNVTGQEVPNNESLTPILAYYFNGENVTDGPLKIAIVGPEGLATYKPLWVECVVELDVISSDVSVPEFPAFFMSVIFMIAPVATVVVARTLRKRLYATLHYHNVQIVRAHKKLHTSAFCNSFLLSREMFLNTYRLF
jgi:hypothetical protein